MPQNLRTNSLKKQALICLTPLIFTCFFFGGTARSEDCLGTLPTADCTLDEDTNGDLTIDNGVTLFIDSPVTINNNIDGDDNPGDGTISTLGAGTTVIQNGDIGTNVLIDELLINDDNTWTTSGAIQTNADGSDINLGVGDGGETLNFLNGSSFVGEIDGNALDVVTFGSDGNGGDFQTAGQIEAVTLIVNSGSLTANDGIGTGIGLNSLSIADGASLIMNDTVTVDGVLDNDGTINIASDSTLTADSYTADADSGTFIINVARNMDASQTGVLNVANGGPLDLSNDTIQIGINPESAVLVNETLANIVVGNTAASIAPGQFVDESFLYDFALEANGENFDLVITVNPLDDVTDNFNNRRVAQVILDNLASIDNVELNRIQSLLGAATSGSAFNETLESLHPTVDGGIITTSHNIAKQMRRLSQRRTETLIENRTSVKKLKSQKNQLQKRTLLSGGKNLQTGKVTRREVKEYPPYDRTVRINDHKGTIWATPFAQSSTQNGKDSVDGFDGTTFGLVVGADTGYMHEDIIFGMAASFANSAIESDNANSTTTDMESYGVKAFGGVRVAENTLLEGSAAYIRSRSDYVRRNIAGIRGNDASAGFDTEHYNLHSKLSKRYTKDDNFTVTPSVFLNYDSVETAGFLERGADFGALEVEPGGFASFEAGAGVEVDWVHETEGGNLINPSAYAEYKYDVISDRVKTSANFVAEPEELFISRGFEAQKHQVNLGAALDAKISKKVELYSGYDFEYKEEYNDHALYGGVTYSFN